MIPNEKIEKLMKKNKFHFATLDEGYWAFQSTHGIIHIQNWKDAGILNFWIYIDDIDNYSDLSQAVLIWLLKKNSTARQGGFAIIENVKEKKKGLILINRIQTADLDWSEFAGTINSLIATYDETKTEIHKYLKKPKD